MIYDAEHFFDGWKANPELCRENHPGRGRGWSAIDRAVRHQWWQPAGRDRRVDSRKRSPRCAIGPVGIHCHNDCDLAVANSLAAVDAGAVQVQGTINGFGERCGNADLISVIANLGLKKQGYQVLGGRELEPPDRALALRVRNRQHELPAQPAVCRAKAPSPTRAACTFTRSIATRPATSTSTRNLVGNERRILVSELSGRSNIVALTTKHNIEHDRDVDGQDSGRGRGDGESRATSSRRPERRSTCWSRSVPAPFSPTFERIKYHVEVGRRTGAGTRSPKPRSRLRVGGRDATRSGRRRRSGQRPGRRAAKSIERSLSAACARCGWSTIKVRVVNSEAGTAARIRVLIESRRRHDVWGTVGVSENIIEASWMALVDAIEYKLSQG